MKYEILIIEIQCNDQRARIHFILLNVGIKPHVIIQKRNSIVLKVTLEKQASMCSG